MCGFGVFFFFDSLFLISYQVGWAACGVTWKPKVFDNFLASA